MADTGRPVTGYPAPNPNGYAGHQPPPATAYPYPAAYYGNQSYNPYYQPDPNAVRRPTWLRRILAVAIGLLVIIAAVTFIVWLVLRPQFPEFRVDSLSLTNLTLGNTSVVSFSSEVRLTVRNPNKKMTLEYDDIQASINYKSLSISQTRVGPFSQGKKNDTSLTANFAAVGSVANKPLVDGMNNEIRNNGNVELNLSMLSRVKFKAKAWRTWGRRLRVFCGDLRVSIPNNGQPGTLIGGSKQCREGP